MAIISIFKLKINTNMQLCYILFIILYVKNNFKIILWSTIQLQKGLKLFALNYSNELQSKKIVFDL